MEDGKGRVIFCDRALDQKELWRGSVQWEKHKARRQEPRHQPRVLNSLVSWRFLEPCNLECRRRSSNFSRCNMRIRSRWFSHFFARPAWNSRVSHLFCPRSLPVSHMLRVAVCKRVYYLFEESLCFRLTKSPSWLRLQILMQRRPWYKILNNVNMSRALDCFFELHYVLVLQFRQYFYLSLHTLLPLRIYEFKLVVDFHRIFLVVFLLKNELHCCIGSMTYFLTFSYLSASLPSSHWACLPQGSHNQLRLHLLST